VFSRPITPETDAGRSVNYRLTTHISSSNLVTKHQRDKRA
jgi:hypothetical protein